MLCGQADTHPFCLHDHALPARLDQRELEMLMTTSPVPRYRNPLAAAPLLVRLIGLWLGRWHQRQDLRELDQRMLNDVGISRVQRNHELGWPFLVVVGD